MKPRILICGAGGQVGKALVAAKCDYERVSLARGDLDITDEARVDSAISRIAPAIVINAAAYTQVDRAEQETEQAFAINRDGVVNLARACRSGSIPLLHVSTDYVFDGNKQGAYTEQDPVKPLGVYGQSKAEGEAELARVLEQHIVLRTSWVFSADGNNFVKTMLRLGRERDELGIVDDQQGCPTSVDGIAAALLQIADRYLAGDEIEWGCYHYCGAPPTTWYEFAREIFGRAEGYENLVVRPIATSDYPTPAKRPRNSVLDCSKLQRQFAIEPDDWRRQLDRVIAAAGC